MPSNIKNAVHFLETQWSSINENKKKGIEAEIRFREFLLEQKCHFIHGGWILSPGNPSKKNPPTHCRICLIPIIKPFSWSKSSFSATASGITPAQFSANAYFGQVGIPTYFASPSSIPEKLFSNPRPKQKNSPASYPEPYQLAFHQIDNQGQFQKVPLGTIMREFPKRRGRIGMRCYSKNRLDLAQFPWNDPASVTELLWFEYCRYFVQKSYLVSNNDLDMFLVGQSGASYPVEFKSKVVANDSSMGDWFGLDVGPFAKLAFFTSRSMNMDALYVVEEVTGTARQHVNWWGIKFTDLLGSCSWVQRGGGQGMMGGSSATIRVPKVSFVPMTQLLNSL